MPEPLLPDELVRALYSELIALELHSSRKALFLGVPVQIQAAIALAEDGKPRSQLLIDLGALNTMSGEVCHLATWLRNAQLMRGDSSAESSIDRSLRVLETGGHLQDGRARGGLLDLVHTIPNASLRSLGGWSSSPLRVAIASLVCPAIVGAMYLWGGQDSPWLWAGLSGAMLTATGVLLLGPTFYRLIEKLSHGVTYRSGERLTSGMAHHVGWRVMTWIVGPPWIPIAASALTLGLTFHLWFERSRMWGTAEGGGFTMDMALTLGGLSATAVMLGAYYASLRYARRAMDEGIREPEGRPGIAGSFLVAGLCVLAVVLVNPLTLFVGMRWERGLLAWPLSLPVATATGWLRPHVLVRSQILGMQVVCGIGAAVATIPGLLVAMTRLAPRVVTPAIGGLLRYTPIAVLVLLFGASSAWLSCSSASPKEGGLAWRALEFDPEEAHQVGSADTSPKEPEGEPFRRVTGERTIEFLSTEFPQWKWAEVVQAEPDLAARFGLAAWPSARTGHDLPVESVSYCEVLRFLNLWSLSEGAEPPYLQLPDTSASWPTWKPEIVLPCHGPASSVDVPAVPHEQITASDDSLAVLLLDCELGLPIRWNCGSQGYRLPSEYEWEVYAKGLGARRDLSPALRTRRASEAVFGNVWEMTIDPLVQPGEERASQDQIVIRGGGYWHGPDTYRAENRAGTRRDWTADDMGFRPVRWADDPGRSDPVSTPPAPSSAGGQPAAPQPEGGQRHDDGLDADQ